MAVSGITYIQENGKYYKVETNGKQKEIDQTEFERGIFAAENNTPVQGAQPKTPIVKADNPNLTGLEEQYGNPDAGAGSGATVATSEKTTVTLPSNDPQFITRLQTQNLIKSGDTNGNFEVAPEKMDALLKALGDYYSTPENMNEIEFSKDSDPDLKAKIQQQLENAGIVDKDGKILDPGKFAQIARDGLNVDGQVFKFAAEDDGTVDVPVTKTVTTTATSKFKEFDPECLAKMKKQNNWEAQMKELQKQGTVVIIDGRYYTNKPEFQKKTAPDITGNTTAIDTTTLVGNKTAQDVREHQLQEDFLLAYDTDSDNAQDTLMHTKYYKEYVKLKDALRTINKGDVSDPKKKDYGNEVAYRPKSVLARAYYAESRSIIEKDENGNPKTVHEYATPEEVRKFEENRDKALKSLTEDQNNLIAEAKQKAKEAGKDPDNEYQNYMKRDLIDKYKKYFGDVVDDNISELSELQLRDLADAQVYETGLTDAQINHMASTQFKNRFNTQMSNVYHEYQAKIDEANAKGKTDKAKKLEEERDKKLREIGAKKIETENQDRADYASMMSRGQLNSEIGEGNFKKAAEGMTYESIIAKCPKAKDFIEANKNLFFKDDQFDPAAWQNFWLSKSSTRVDNDQDSHERIQDYFMQLGEAQDIVRGNANGTEKEGYKGLRNIYGKDMSENAMIDLARDMAETAGIVTEKNNTAGIRTGFVFGEIGKGVAGAAAADLLGNFALSKLRIKYAGDVVGKVTGSVKGIVTGTVTGTVPFARSGTVQGLDKFVSEYYDNGTLVGSQVTERITEHPWSVEGEEPFSKDFSKGYEQSYEKGYKDHYSGSKSVGAFHFDPISLAIGGVAGGIKGLLKMGEKHDKEDKNSGVQMYSRRDYEARTTTTSQEIQGTQQVAAKKYVANFTQEKPAVNEPIENISQKVTVRRGKGTVLYKGRQVPFNEAEDKKHLVASMYNLTGDELEKVFNYLITEFNGLPERYLKGHNIPEGNILNFPTKIPAGTIPGIDHDIDTSGFDSAKYQKKWIKVPQVQGAKVPKNQKAGSQDLSTNKPGSNANASATARRRRRP